MNRGRYLAILFIASTISVFSISFSSFSQEKPKVEKEGYLESRTPEACKLCHEEIFEAFKKEDPHYQTVLDPRLPVEKKGCESCHGPGQKHLNKEEGFISFKDKNAKIRSDPCLKCHQREKTFFQFNRGVHKLSAVGCNDCHQIHKSPWTKNLLKGKETDLCFSCHPEVKYKFYLPTRHKVLEGALTCSDCHTSHGKRTRASLRTWNKFDMDICFKCHPEKRGPWVFEHPSVKFEGCTTCHEPMGSPNRFLLIRADVRSVCIQCHGQRHFNPNSCVNCHTQIHGSNFSRFFHH